MLRHLAAVAVMTFASIGPALAGGASVGDIQITQAWARATIGQAPNGAAYMTLVNEGEESDYLIGASTSVANAAELHTVSMENGVMKMRAMEEVEVAPGEPTVFAPGGMHVMLVGLKQKLTAGEFFPIVLSFKNAGDVQVSFDVQPIGAMNDQMQHGQMNHSDMHQPDMDHGSDGHMQHGN